MRKKSFMFFLIVLLVLSGAVFAQNYQVSNELGSEGLYQTRGDDSGFAGLYDEVSGLIHFSKFSVQGEYRLILGDGFDTYNLYGHVKKANIWFRPVQGLEIAVGNEFYLALPGSFMKVYDDYSPNGWYGKEKFGLSFTYKPVRFGMNIPEMSFGDDFSMKINLGVDVSLNEAFNIGAAYRMDNESFGLFANYSGKKGLYVGGGYVYNGVSLLDIQVDHLVDFTILYDTGRFSLGGDLELTFTEEEQTPFYNGLIFMVDITRNLAFEADTKWFVLFRDNDNLNDPWELTVHPRFVFSSGKHELVGGVKFLFAKPGALKDSDADKADVNFAIPVSWKYTF